MPSLQAVPTGAGVPLQMPVPESHTPSWHPTLSAEQSLGKPPPHSPILHVLLVLQRSPVSTHGVLSLLESGVPMRFPVAGSQPTALHSFSGEKEQSLGRPVHIPRWQTPSD